jgi:hypothetical protein
VRTFKDHVVFEAEEIRGSTGDPLQRYSAYRARWWTRWRAATPPLLSSPARLRGQRTGASPPLTALPTAEDLGYLTAPCSSNRERRKRCDGFAGFFMAPFKGTLKDGISPRSTGHPNCPPTSGSELSRCEPPCTRPWARSPQAAAGRVAMCSPGSMS